MKRSVFSIFAFTLLSICAIADNKVYFIDGASDFDNVKDSGWIFVEDTAIISKEKIDVNQSKLLKVFSMKKKPSEIKLFASKNDNKSECISIKRGCGSSR